MDAETKITIAGMTGEALATQTLLLMLIRQLVGRDPSFKQNVIKAFDETEDMLTETAMRQGKLAPAEHTKQAHLTIAGLREIFNSFPD